MRRQTASRCAFRRIGPRKGDVTTAPRKTPCFDTNDVEIKMCLVAADPSRAGCDPGLSRIAYSQKRGPRIGEYAPWSSNIGMVALSTVTVCALSMFVNVSSIGCGCRVAFIAHLAKLGPQTDERTTAPRRFPLLTCTPSRVVCIWCLETRREWDAAADFPALCIREIVPCGCEFPATARPQYTLTRRLRPARHPCITCFEASHRLPSTCCFGPPFDDSWRSHSLELFDEQTLRARIVALTMFLS